MAQKHLVEILNSDANTISTMAARLENEKIIVRKPDKDDKRKRIIRLTKHGAELQHKLWNQSQTLRDHLETLFTKRDMQTMIGSLITIRQAMQDFQCR